MQEKRSSEERQALAVAHLLVIKGVRLAYAIEGLLPSSARFFEVLMRRECPVDVTRNDLVRRALLSLQSVVYSNKMYPLPCTYLFYQNAIILR